MKKTAVYLLYKFPMKYKLFFILISSFFITSNFAYPVNITDVNYQSTENFLRVVIYLNESADYNIVNSLQDKKYFYINLYNISKPYITTDIAISDQRVSSLKTAYYPEHKILRFVFYTKPTIQYNITALSKPSRLVVDISEKGFAASEIYRKKIVILDPGHGGKSLGGRSVKKVSGNYIYEKDITLKICKKVKEYFEKTQNVTVFSTRDKDDYISLKDRILFSEKYKGDIFVSVHCNDTRGHVFTKAKGVEFYYWNEQGSDDAAVNYLEELNNDETLEIDISSNNSKLRNILTNVLKDKLEQETTESMKFCNFLDDIFRESEYFRVNNRGIKSARFKVLENYNMPAVLVETGFINNSDEIKKLISPEFQDLVARKIFNSINKYFAKEDPKFQPTYLTLNNK